MASPRDVDPTDAPLSGEAVAAREFTQSRRGYDPDEVRRYLKAVGRELTGLHDRSAELDRRLAEAQTHTGAPDLSEEAIVAAVGQEMADSLRSAHAAATELRKRAADEAETFVAEAHKQAEAQVAEAERRLSEATEESERLRTSAAEDTAKERADAAAAAEEQLTTATAEAAQLRLDAQNDAARIRDEATAEAERRVTEISDEAEQAAAAVKRDATSEAQQTIGKARADAEVIRQETETERADTIATAQALRERVLADLARRRRIATIQIEQLRAGRERLSESYAVVRRTLDEVTEELRRADTEARTAADEVGRRLESDPDLGDLSDLLDDGGPTQAVPVVDAPLADSSPSPAPAEPSPAEPSPAPAEASSASSPVASSPITPPGGTERVRVLSVGAAPVRAQAGKSTVSHLRVVSGSAAVAVEHEHPSAGEVESAEDAKPAELELVKEPAATPAVTDEVVVAEEVIVVEEVTVVEEVVVVPSSSSPSPSSGPAAPPPPARAKGRGRKAAAKEDAVGDLFDRIRSSREQDVDDARQVLDSDAAATGTAPSAVPERPAAPETPASSEVHAGAHVDDPDGTVRSDADEALVQERESVLSGLERTLTHRLKRALQDEQNDLLDRLRGLKGAPSADRVLPTFDEQVQPYREAVEAGLAKAMAAGYEFALERLGTSGGAPDPDTGRALAEAAVGRIVEPLRRRIGEIFAEESEDGFEALNDSLGSVYRTTRNQRVERVAGDVLASGFAAGTWQATPEGASLRWIADDADGPCPDCDDNALAGELPKGEAFPTGQPYPPAHDGCRCLIVPDRA